MQTQLQAIQVGEAALRPNTRSNVEVAKLLTFNRKVRQILEFLTAYMVYIRIRMRRATVEKQCCGNHLSQRINDLTNE